MLIISITIIVMQAINNTTIFNNSSINDMALKSLMFIGCGTFLLTGSQVINRFIGTNVSANSGREQLMSLMSYGHTFSTATHIGANAISGAGAFGLGVASSVLGKAGGNSVVNKVGNAISRFGNNFRGGNRKTYFCLWHREKCDSENRPPGRNSGCRASAERGSG